MHGAPSGLIPGSAHEGRRDERTHLFLAASLSSKAGSCPVHVRNISPTGALIEGSNVPGQGEKLILKRGSLAASATIVWSVGSKAGIAFSSIIQVADWMARKPGTDQSRVDDIIQTIRSAPAKGSGDTGERQNPAPDRPVEAELLALRSNLAELEKGLIGDVVLTATHPEIQLLDIALQSVERMLRMVRE